MRPILLAAWRTQGATFDVGREGEIRALLSRLGAGERTYAGRRGSKEDDPRSSLSGVFPFPSSDHRLVWVDVTIPGSAIRER